MYDKNFLTTGIFILFLSFVNIVLYGQNFQQAPVNQDRIQAKSADWNNLGLIPEFFLPHFGKTPSKKALVAFPSVYDLRTAGPGGTSLVTSAKDQGTCGACWAFAAMGSMESYAKKTGRGDYDLSENNLKECHGFVSAACSGGNDNMISSYLARKSGPVAEIYDPYKPAVLGCKENINPEFWVEDIRFLTPRNADVAKQAILDYGGIVTTMYANDSYYNSTNYTYYYNGSAQTNHSVLLVGWDDSKVTSGGTGAWIIKNSLGDKWGENGFFYVSYNDTKINSVVTSLQTQTEVVPNYVQFGYDELGMIGDYGDNPIGYGLVLFSPGSGTYTLKKLSTFMSSGPATVRFEVYDDFDGTALTNLLATIPDKTCDYPGLYTFDLPTPIQVGANNNFYVKVYYNTVDYNLPIPAELYKAQAANPVIESGKCWISPDGTAWTSIGSNRAIKADLCIHAYAESSCTPPAAPSVVPITQPTCSTATGSVEVTGLPATGIWTIYPGGYTGTGTIYTISALASGTYSFRVVNSAGCSSTGSSDVVINAQPITPAQPGAISGSTVVCYGVPQTFSISDVTGATSYTWTLPAGWSGNSTSASISATPGATVGTISVVANSICGSGTARTLTVTVSEIPGQPGLITGSTEACQNVVKTYSIIAVTGAAYYTWTLPSGWTGSSTSTSITATPGATGGTISVTANNLCGSSTASFVNVSSTVIPGQPGDISGNTAICQGAIQTYSIAEVPDAASYTWTLPSGWSGSSTSASISATPGATGGTISVNATSLCGSGTARTLSVTVTPLPGLPGAISGTASVCQGAVQTYSIAAVNGAVSYTWTLPSGWSGSSTSTSMAATAGPTGGTISVTANNVCGPGASRTVNVTVPAIPEQPGTISGSTTVCTLTSHTYSITAVAGATSYTWSMPSGWSGYSTSTSISSSAGSTGGTISVTANNSCGSSQPSSIIVTSRAKPASPGTITGITPVCQGSDQTYSIADVTDATSYTWTLPSGWSGSSTLTSITAIPGPSGGSVLVTANNECGSSIARSFFVTFTAFPTQPAIINGKTEVCPGSTQNYYIGALSNVASYTWSLPEGWSGSSTGTTISATVGSVGGTISVTANNACGPGAARTVNVTVPAIPEQPGTITGSTTVCTLTSHTYSITAVPGASSYTWTLPSGWSGSSTSASISAIPGANGGTISVEANNACGSGTSRTLTLTVASKPTVTSSMVSSSSTSTGLGGGDVTSNEGSELTERGVCWSLFDNPTTANSKSSDGTSTGSFASTITGLTNGVTYHIRAYATNCAGTGYGSDILYTHNPTGIYDVETGEILVFPNPVSGILNIEYKNDTYKTVSIINSQGRLCAKESVISPRQQLDFSKFESGLYFLEFVKTSGELMRVKVVNQY